MLENRTYTMQTKAADPLESAYRRSILRDIERRIERHGRHLAQPHADRARQFVPFAALKGYEDMAHSREFATIARHEVTAEESRAFSETVSGLRKGDGVRVTYYRQGRRKAIEGALVDKDEALRTMRVGTTDILFDEIESIEASCVQEKRKGRETPGH